MQQKKFDKHEHLACEEILSSDQRRVIENAKFKYSSLTTKLDKQKKKKKKKQSRIMKKSQKKNNWR